MKRAKYKLPDGKYKHTSIYKLKDCWIRNYGNNEAGDNEPAEEYTVIEGRKYTDVKVNNKYMITIDAPYIVRNKQSLHISSIYIDYLSGKYYVKLAGKDYYLSELVDESENDKE